MTEYGILDYLSGLTAYVLDEAVFKAVAFERGVLDKKPRDLSERERDLLLADILGRIYLSPGNLPSMSHQHGQFSTSTGQQAVGERETIYARMMELYRKWNDPKAAEMERPGLEWVNDVWER